MGAALAGRRGFVGSLLDPPYFVYFAFNW
jgi:hypothetical protein